MTSSSLAMKSNSAEELSSVKKPQSRRRKYRALKWTRNVLIVLSLGVWIAAFYFALKHETVLAMAGAITGCATAVTAVEFTNRYKRKAGPF